MKYGVSYVPGERSNEVILPASVISLAEPDLYDFVNHIIHRKQKQLTGYPRILSSCQNVR